MFKYHRKFSVVTVVLFLLMSTYRILQRFYEILKREGSNSLN